MISGARLCRLLLKGRKNRPGDLNHSLMKCYNGIHIQKVEPLSLPSDVMPMSP